MKVYLNSTTGIADAMVSMLMSKRNWTKAKEDELRELVYNNVDYKGNLNKSVDPKFAVQMDKLIKYGVDQTHTTLLRFIDLSFTVEGLHRGGQDDWDSHTKRFDNRLIRASTRLGDFKEGEVSDYYKDKIRFPFQVLEALGIAMPLSYVDRDTNQTFVKAEYGYVLEDMEDNKDVKRGLYPESIPSNFIFKIQYPELCHVTQFRDLKSNANPEVQELAERIKIIVTVSNEWLGNNLSILKMEPK